MHLRLLTIFAASTCLITGALGAPNPEAKAVAEAVAEAIAEPEGDLTPRACTSLSKNQCHASSGAKGGVYCGWCPQVLGTYWDDLDHYNYAYQLNGQDGSCCTYGYRKSCAGSNLDQCPI